MKRVTELEPGAPMMQEVAVRVAPANYLVALLFSLFLSAFVLYLEADASAFLLLALVLVAAPVLAFTDRIVFDGRRIRRTGLLPRLWAGLTSTRDRIKVSDIETVNTHVIRTIKRGANLIYTYRTAIYGKGKSFTIHSNRKSYGQFIESVLPLLGDDLLDRRSIELRDHFAERAEVRERARAAKIPSSEILEDSLGGRKGITTAYSGNVVETENEERAAYLHDLANQLRVSGLLPQAVEAFRRAARLMPRDARLLLDFALCLKTYATARRDRRVERRARALMRLAERRAGDDAHLLSHIGESYFQFGDWQRAAAVFRRAADRTGEHFRTLIGLAEISLHEGKIAHVIHNFTAASESAGTPALRRWTRQELEYFSRLNDDEEYMELEISRLNLLDTLESVKRSALRIAIVGFPVIVIGLLVGDDLIANIGWAVSLVSFTIWAAMILGINMLSARIPYDLIGK
jgi:tetratricopeptide (TPR) repeat protein